MVWARILGMYAPWRYDLGSVMTHPSGHGQQLRIILPRARMAVSRYGPVADLGMCLLRH